MYFKTLNSEFAGKMVFYFCLRNVLLIKKTLRIMFVQKEVTFLICFREVLTQQGTETEASQSDELLIGRERMSGQEY